jgi:hypothetical protein
MRSSWLRGQGRISTRGYLGCSPDRRPRPNRGPSSHDLAWSCLLSRLARSPAARHRQAPRRSHLPVRRRSASALARHGATHTPQPTCQPPAVERRCAGAQAAVVGNKRYCQFFSLAATKGFAYTSANGGIYDANRKNLCCLHTILPDGCIYSKGMDHGCINYIFLFGLIFLL